MENLPRATVSSFSAIKIGEIKRWLAKSDAERISVLLLHGPSGTGKRTSLGLLLRDLSLAYEEIFIDTGTSSLDALLDVACLSSCENVVLYPEFIHPHEVSSFVDSLAQVSRISQVKKRILVVFSLETFTQLSWAPLHCSITKIHIPPITEQKIIKILQSYVQTDPSFRRLPNAGAIDISTIAQHSHGDLRYAIQQLYWIRMPAWDGMEAVASAGFDVRTLLYSPDRVSLKLLCGKDEYNSLHSMDFVDGVNPHALVESLRKNLVRYFIPSGIHALARTLRALALSETCIPAPGSTDHTRPYLFVFLSAYRMYNPSPTRGRHEPPSAADERKRPLFRNTPSWNAQVNGFISLSIEERLHPGEGPVSTHQCVHEGTGASTQYALHLEDDDIEID